MGGSRSRVAAYVAYLVVLTLLFSHPLGQLFQYAIRSSLHSHILLVPLLSAYLLCTARKRLPARYSMSPAGGGTTLTLGLAALAASRLPLSLNDQLAVTTAAFVCLVGAGGFLLLGAAWMRAAAFPWAFLVFMVPTPDAAAQWLERAFAAASAESAALCLGVAGTPLVRHGTVFELPGIVLQVGKECSGIRSSWVLLITSVLASHLFLRSWPRKIALVLLVIPLGILRNAVRILVIGLLCVHVGPYMIDSPIHHRGGPVFFALSLVPLFLLLYWFRRREQAAGASR